MCNDFLTSFPEVEICRRRPRRVVHKQSLNDEWASRPPSHDRQQVNEDEEEWPLRGVDLARCTE